MRAPKQATRMTRRAYTLLAALMLADGAWVSRRELAHGLYSWEISLQKLSIHAATAERYAGVWIARQRHLGYRLVALPPDEHLESMLACVPAVKRSAWWLARADERGEMSA